MLLAVVAVKGPSLQGLPRSKVHDLGLLVVLQSALWLWVFNHLCLCQNIPYDLCLRVGLLCIVNLSGLLHTCSSKEDLEDCQALMFQLLPSMLSTGTYFRCTIDFEDKTDAYLQWLEKGCC